MLLCALGASLLGNLLTVKGIYGAGKGKGINRAGEGAVIRVVVRAVMVIPLKWIFNTASSFN